MSGASQIGSIRSQDESSGSVRRYGGEGGTRLNNAVIDTPPSVDRSKKEKALLRYSGGNVSGLEDVLKIEEDMVEESVIREKKNLEMEQEWEMMRLRKEKEHEEDMGEELRKKQDEMLKQLDTLTEDNRRKDEEDVKLRKELKMVRRELEKRDTEEKEIRERQRQEKQAQERLREKEEEQRRTRREVEEKRRRRKELEMKERRMMDEKRAKEDQRRKEERK